MVHYKGMSVKLDVVCLSVCECCEEASVRETFDSTEHMSGLVLMSWLMTCVCSDGRLADKS